MIEINLPCCAAPVVVECDASEVVCEACGLALDLAPDARLDVVPVAGPADSLALPVAA